MKTVIMTHSDSDGICAGAIALSKFPGAQIFFTKPVSFFDDLNTVDAERIIITDIAITHKDTPEILKLLEDKGGRSEIMYFDHHSLPDSARKRLADTLAFYINGEGSASELVYRHFCGEVADERIWVAIYGAIGDYEEKTEFIRKHMKKWDARALYFEAGLIILGTKDRDFDDYESKRRIVHMLAEGKNPSDIPGLMEAARRTVTDEFKLYEIVKANAKKSGDIGFVKDVYSFGFRGPSALFAATVTDSRVGLAAYTRKNKFDITMRSSDYSIRLNDLVEKAADAVGGAGGGHLHAAGARIPLDKFDDFLNEVNRLIKAA